MSESWSGEAALRRARERRRLPRRRSPANAPRYRRGSEVAVRAMMLRLPGADGSPRDVDGSPLYESVEALERLVADRLGVEDAALRVRRC